MDIPFWLQIVLALAGGGAFIVASTTMLSLRGERDEARGDLARYKATIYRARRGQCPWPPEGNIRDELLDLSKPPTGGSAATPSPTATSVKIGPARLHSRGGVIWWQED